MLNHIKQKVCPDCGVRLISETRNNQHSNGYWNEEVTFKCGAVFNFSPNYMIVRQSKPCSQTAEEKTKKYKRETALEKTKAYIKDLDVDDDFRNTLFERFSYVRLD